MNENDRIEELARRRQEAEGALYRGDGGRYYFAHVADPLRGRTDEPDHKAKVRLSEERREGVVRS